MLNLILIWIAVGVALVLVSGRSSAGLLLAYFFSTSLIYFPGAMLHLQADEWNWTRLGFEETVIGMAAFLAGAIIAKIFKILQLPKQNASVGRPNDIGPTSLAELNRLALVYCLLGGFAYFVLLPSASAISSATAVISSIGSLTVVGICLRLWAAREGRDRWKFLSTIALLPILPLSTLIQSGFLGFGTVWALTVSTFIFAQTRRRLLYLSLAPVVLYVGMSLFVNYMAARDDIRKLVWYQQASLVDRLDRVEEVFQNFEWLDLSNAKHRRAIENRLNQNLLVGAAVTKLKSEQKSYTFGAAISNMFLALIPRALWPDKPQVGGGGNIVTEYTGIRFARGTSVGAGQVLEFYVNFGTGSVIVGFVLLGWLLGYLDLTIIEALRLGDQSRFLFSFMIAMSLLQPGGNLIEIAASLAGAATSAYALNYFFKRRRSVPAIPPLHRKISV